MISISSAHNEARLTGTMSFIDGGASSGKIQIFSGARPANGQVGSGELLVEIPLTKPCGLIASGQLRLTAAEMPLVIVSGVPSWARVLNGSGAHVMDCDVGAGGEIVLSTTPIYAGGVVALTSAVLG
jgi:hypothetical protein